MSLRRRQKLYRNGYILIGGGVGDSYQPIEKQYQLTRKTLEFINSLALPVHILTKSTLLERDIDIFHQIKQKSGVLLSFSFSSTNDDISRIFEPGVPPPSERLHCIHRLKEEGFSCGVFLLPVIPFITDTAKIMQQTIKDLNDANIDYIIFGGMTLKAGRQKECYYDVLRKHFPELITDYVQTYKDPKWGNATNTYYQSINQTFHAIIQHYPIPSRIPLPLFTDFITTEQRVVILLEHLDYFMRLQGKKSPFGYAAYQLSQQKQPIATMRYQLQDIKGIGPVTDRIIQEILDTKTCSYYEKLIKG
jgi:DNA repair photolyase